MHCATKNACLQIVRENVYLAAKVLSMERIWECRQHMTNQQTHDSEPNILRICST